MISYETLLLSMLIQPQGRHLPIILSLIITGPSSLSSTPKPAEQLSDPRAFTRPCRP